MTFSIIVPTKNEEIYLPKLFASLARQTVQPAEVIVADAGSTDATCAIAQEHGARIVEGGLPSVGRNRGAKVADTDMLVFLDADVEFEERDFLEKSLCEFNDRKLDASSSLVRAASHAKLDHFFTETYNRYVLTVEPLFRHASGSCMYARRAFHEQIGGFDETVVFCEDSEYAQRAGKYGRFAFLRSVHIPYQTRRLERDGHAATAVRYVLAELHMATIGPIRHNGFKYRFGYATKHSASEVRDSTK